MSHDNASKYNLLQMANIGPDAQYTKETVPERLTPSTISNVDPLRYKVDAGYRKQFFAENASSIEKIAQVMAAAQTECTSLDAPGPDTATIMPTHKDHENSKHFLAENTLALFAIIRAFIAIGKSVALEERKTVPVIDYLDPKDAERKAFKESVSHLITEAEYDAYEVKNDFSEPYIRQVLTVINAALALTEKWAMSEGKVIYNRFEQLTHAVLIIYQFIENCMFNETHKIHDLIFRDAERYFAGRLQETDNLFPPENRYWYQLGDSHHHTYDTNDKDKYSIVEKPLAEETIALAKNVEAQIRFLREAFISGRMV